MSPRMLSCPACQRHVLATSTTCLHCGEDLPVSGARTTAVAALLGLALVGCPTPGGGDTGMVALYGVPDTGDTADSGEDTADSGEDTADTSIGDLYGVPDTGNYTDNDGDGYSEADGDCDDTNADIHPGATETAGDGVDSNCDGHDDT